MSDGGRRDAEDAPLSKREEEAAQESDFAIELSREEVQTLRAFLSQMGPEDASDAAASFKMMMFHSGPLPTPGDLAGYDDALPGAAKTIMTMAEDEQRHRHELNRHDQDRQDRALELGHQRAVRAQNFGVWLFTLLVVGGIVGVVTGNQLGGFTLLATGIVAHIVNAFGGRFFPGKADEPPKEKITAPASDPS